MPEFVTPESSDDFDAQFSAGEDISASLACSQKEGNFSPLPQPPTYHGDVCHCSPRHDIDALWPFKGQRPVLTTEEIETRPATRGAVESWIYPRARGQASTNKMDRAGYSSPGYNTSPYDGYGSATPTPSPHRPFYTTSPIERPHTRAPHVRMSSHGDRHGFVSPRYNSSGHYATVDVNVSDLRTRKPSFSGGNHGPAGGPSGGRGRRNSYSYYRASDSHGESDEDEIFEIDGVAYILPARARAKPPHHGAAEHFLRGGTRGGYGTDHHYYSQKGAAVPQNVHDSGYGSSSPRPTRQAATPKPSSHARRNSHSAAYASQGPIPRSQTVQPGLQRRGSSAGKKASAPQPAPPPRKQATDADAKRYGIPQGYSLKNWDGNEEPILLLGSVFDANSLGKWIYDWTVYHHGPATPISDMAGDMWLLLINLAGKIRKAEDAIPIIRAADKKMMVEEFIEAGERLTDKLRKLLKTCEAPMLKAAQRDRTGLGKDAGVQFVRTLFGRERELEKTEKFMQSVRLWNLRFDANCAEILANPTR